MIKSLEDLRDILRQFADDRDWEQFHSPKNLAMALGVEVAELAEHFQWLTQQQSLSLGAEKKEAVSAELADVLIYLVRLADRLDVNLLTAAEKKIAVNGEKYPVSESRGRSDRPDSSGETS
jgi:NTP pyrophosphatase (non-canonical NTP hydrolase)